MEPATHTQSHSENSFDIRPVQAADLTYVIALDETITGLAKPEYWRDWFARYEKQRGELFFLVAVHNTKLIGFAIGEIRAWEFGSEPCGWVFAINVDPDARLHGVGARMLDEICDQFKGAGVKTVRTMLARDDTLIMSFFRSQGLMAGPYIQLEKELG